MAYLRGVVVLLAAIEALAMIANGFYGLLTGGYIVLRKGARAADPAMWEGIVAAAGVAPRSPGMKLFLIAYGATWLVLTYRFARRRPGSRAALAAAILGSFWYLGPGTPVSIALLFLLALLPPTTAPSA